LFTSVQKDVLVLVLCVSNRVLEAAPFRTILIGKWMVDILFLSDRTSLLICQTTMRV